MIDGSERYRPTCRHDGCVSRLTVQRGVGPLWRPRTGRFGSLANVQKVDDINHRTPVSPLLLFFFAAKSSNHLQCLSINHWNVEGLARVELLLDATR